MVRVIVNADDIGMTAGVTRGIVRSITQGIASSATFMASMPNSEDAAAQIIKHGLAVGVHLNITQGRPLMSAVSVPSLVNSSGAFWTVGELSARLRNGQVSLHEVGLEFGRQVQRTIDLGITPTHLDSHHHVHGSLGVAKALYRVATRFDIRSVRTLHVVEPIAVEALANLAARDHIRRRTRERQPTGKTTRTIRVPVALLKPGDEVQDWIRMFEALSSYSGSGVFEVICHPAEADADLRRVSEFTASRERELAVLTSPGLIAAVSGLPVELVTFRDL